MVPWSQRLGRGNKGQAMSPAWWQLCKWLIREWDMSGKSSKEALQNWENIWLSLFFDGSRWHHYHVVHWNILMALTFYLCLSCPRNQICRSAKASARQEKDIEEKVEEEVRKREDAGRGVQREHHHRGLLLPKQPNPCRLPKHQAHHPCQRFSLFSRSFPSVSHIAFIIICSIWLRSPSQLRSQETDC